MYNLTSEIKTKRCLMPSIIKKKIKNGIYYYYVESKRVDGKPKYVNQKYLGTAEAILKKIRNADPLYSIILDFADAALLYDIALRFNVVDIINKHFKKRNQGLSFGEYALIAAINRTLAPTSKSNIAEWYSKTILSRLMNINEKMLSPQNYWNQLLEPYEYRR